jgi:hypothetical protein
MLTPAPGSSTRSTHDEFVDLLCADEELLRAEFDAIVAAEWPGEPPLEFRPRGDGPRWPAPTPPSEPHRPGRRTRRRVDEWARQRSPPGEGERAVRP